MNMLSLVMLSSKHPIMTHDLVVTFGGFCIVICALIILFLIFKEFSKLINKDFKKKNEVKNEAPKTSTAAGWKVDDDLAVVIGLALSLSQEVHDTEADEVTITRVERRYSPWSSKIYGLNGLNRR
ncbi:MAG: OadG family protein [Bacteroidales bacterium]|nr:OadG family protein [Bacteroidales bacterium]